MKILFSSPGIEPGTSGYLSLFDFYKFITLQTAALPTELQRGLFFIFYNKNSFLYNVLKIINNF